MTAKVVEVAFGPRRALERLSQLPPAEDHEEGDALIHSDGEFLRVLEVKRGAWVEHCRFPEKAISAYLLRQRLRRQRAMLSIQCETGHEMRGGQCWRCGYMKPKKWEICRSSPQAGAEDLARGHGPNGESFCHISTWDNRSAIIINGYKCRRRAGHDGPCGWVNACPGREPWGGNNPPAEVKRIGGAS